MATLLQDIGTVVGAAIKTDRTRITNVEATVANLATSGRKNYLINGNFSIWQRGTSQTTHNYGSDDRWHNYGVGSTKTHSRIQCGDLEKAITNSKFYSRTIVNSVSVPGNHVDKFQRIENVSVTAGKVVTLSFWARSDSNRNMAVDFEQIHSLSTTTKNGIGATTIPLTTVWQKKSVTVTVPNLVGQNVTDFDLNTSSFTVVFWFDAGTNFNNRTNSLGHQSGTFDIMDVVLCDGNTPLKEWHPYDGEFGGELIACKRYCEVGSAIGGFAQHDDMYAYVTFSVTKRVTPSIVIDATTTVYSNLIRGGKSGVPIFVALPSEKGCLVINGDLTPHYPNILTDGGASANDMKFVVNYSASAEL